MVKISVIILTHDRPELVFQAIQSVFDQHYESGVEVVVGGDNCNYIERLKNISVPDKRFLKVLDLKSPDEVDTCGKCAWLRNTCALETTGDFIAFLDDDNVYCVDHLSSLYELVALENIDAAHSWRQVVDNDGKPYYFSYYPWAPKEQKFSLCEYYKENKVIVDGSNLLRDAVYFQNGDKGFVDTSCWLIKREIFLLYPFPEKRSAEEVKNNKGEDDMLLARFIANGVRIDCTQNASMIYRLGGYSND